MHPTNQTTWGKIVLYFILLQKMNGFFSFTLYRTKTFCENCPIHSIHHLIFLPPKESDPKTQKTSCKFDFCSGNTAPEIVLDISKQIRGFSSKEQLLCKQHTTPSTKMVCVCIAHLGKLRWKFANRFTSN